MSAIAKRVLHIVGSFGKPWAITNRATYLARHLLPEWDGRVIGKLEYRAVDPAEYDVVHVHSQVILRVLLGDPRYAHHRCWGFEAISVRSMDLVLESPAAAVTTQASAKFCIIKNPRMAPLVAPLAGDQCTVRYIPNGVETDLFLPATIRVGWCGNKSPKSTAHKGVELIRDAVSAVAEKWRKQLTIEFVTDPGDAPRRVLTHGEIAPWYRTLDVYVSASKSEGCSNTILEALASGVPAISTNAGIAPELAAECDLTICERSRGAIARALMKVLGPRLKRRRLMTSEYDWRHIAARYGELYREALK